MELDTMNQESPTTGRFRIMAMRVLTCFLILGAWQTIVKENIWDETIVPSPSGIIAAIWEYRENFENDIASTVKLIITGFILTVTLAFLIAILLHLLPKVKQSLYWLLVMLQCVPLFAIAPVLFYWTGRDRVFLDQLITIVLAAFFPVLITTAHGLKHVNQDLVDLFDSLNATKLQRLWHLEIPSALQIVIAGSKITLTMCVVGAVLAEMLVGDMSGLGFRMKDANAHMNMAEVFAGLVLLAAVSIGLFWVLGILARRMQPWVEREEAE
jgi:ABC-type nitrate/sulfonate/bicarbonate transport system permease component